jgi:hypothetical protein
VRPLRLVRMREALHLLQQLLSCSCRCLAASASILALAGWVRLLSRH